MAEYRITIALSGDDPPDGYPDEVTSEIPYLTGEDADDFAHELAGEIGGGIQVYMGGRDSVTLEEKVGDEWRKRDYYDTWIKRQEEIRGA